MGRVYDMKARKDKKPVKIKSVIVVLLSVYLAYTLATQYIVIRKSRAQEAAIRAQIEEIKKENERLKEELERIRSDEYIEKVARERLGLIKSGEIMFVDVNHSGENGSN